MGYSSVILKRQSVCYEGKITEASDLKYFNMPLIKAIRDFEFVEYCDNGKTYLKNHDGSFICIEK
jgi:hypothetical protein